jgi:cell division protein FtsL
MTTANIFSDRLENIKEMFLNLISQMDLTILNYKLYPNDQTYNNDFMNWKYNIDTCNKNLTTLSNEVSDGVTASKDTVSDIFQSLGVTSDVMNMISKLFENKNISNDMNIYSLNLYNNQIILNWEIFIGMLLLFFYLIYYYRKYYNTKQVIDFTKQKIIDMNKDAKDNIQAAKEEISKI